jgi:hypothetical protein
MTKVIINEGLDYHDLEGIVLPIVSVDEYSAQMGKDSEIVTLAFTVKNKNAGEDLADWFERGYDFVLDSQVSDGELSTGKYLVFVEMNRRTTVPERIVTLLDDMETLTNMKLKEWTVIFDEEEYEPDADILKQVLTISPHKYRQENENGEELNEMRQNAGLETVSVFPEQDSEIKAFKAMAGL